jgi:hypothetical protein
MKRIGWIIGSICISMLIVFGGMHLWQQVYEARLVASRTIELTKKGFVPRHLTIQQGEHVTFISKIGASFWPASNLHPSHMLYSEFDPKQPIEKDTPWKFVFDRPGVWRFHDHMYPEFTGSIIVLGPGQVHPDRLPCDDMNTHITVRQQCWDELLSTALETKGIAGAFAVFSKLYKTDKDFVTSGCHAHAHQIGDAFYRDYAAKRRTLVGVELPPETMACGYGFFHGLFEHFFRKNPDIRLVRSICDDLDARYGEVLPLLRINCFHGAGHGLIPDPPDVGIWGNMHAMVSESLALCDAISTNAGEIEQCKEGVFNVIADWMARGEYGLSYDDDDPLGPCRTLAQSHKEACYYELVMKMSVYENRSLAAIAKKFVEPIEEPYIAEIVIRSLSASFMQMDIALPSQTHLLLACRELSAFLQAPCLEGIISGFRSHGEPGNEYKKAVEFCSVSIMSKEERDVCFVHLVQNLWYLYSEDKVRTICDTLDTVYKPHCQNNPVKQWQNE